MAEPGAITASCEQLHLAGERHAIVLTGRADTAD
jgi:hypothetical protein